MYLNVLVYFKGLQICSEASSLRGLNVNVLKMVQNLQLYSRKNARLYICFINNDHMKFKKLYLKSISFAFH